MNQATSIPDQSNEIVATFLNILLADEYILYTKTRSAHWNVEGSKNFELHVFLENQFNTLDNIIDEIAEQIRSLGHFASGSLKDFLSISKMNNDSHNLKKTKEIFEMLRNDHDAMIRMIQHEVVPISKKLKDKNTAIFITGIMEQHKKMAWMLRFFMSHPEFNVEELYQTTNDQVII